MMTITIEEAQARLPQLIDQLAPGEEVVISGTSPADGQARRACAAEKPRTPGSGKGKLIILQRTTTTSGTSRSTCSEGAARHPLLALVLAGRSAAERPRPSAVIADPLNGIERQPGELLGDRDQDPPGKVCPARTLSRSSWSGNSPRTTCTSSPSSRVTRRHLPRCRFHHQRPIRPSADRPGDRREYPDHQRRCRARPVWRLTDLVSHVHRFPASRPQGLGRRPCSPR